MKRFTAFSCLVAAAIVLLSCGGSSTLDDTDAAVYITMDVEQYNPDIDVCTYLAVGSDVTIETLIFQSNAKAPGTSLPDSQDVRLVRWVVTPERNDGGETASPQAIFDQGVMVPAGGDTTLENYRVYPVENLNDVPLGYLLPENGGVDPETGNRNIRQRLVVQAFGETMSGKAVATIPQSVQFNFFCGRP